MSESHSDVPAPARQGKAWSNDEDRRVYDAFIGGTTGDAIAAAHERSLGAIRSRLQRLGLLDPDGNIVTPPPPFTATVRERLSRAGAEADDPTMRTVFAVKMEDGYAVELRANYPLSRPMVDRLTALLDAVLEECGRG
jgi:hypothetical protein